MPRVEAGTLDQLAEEARAAADQKIENGEALDTLIEIANGHAPKVIPRIEARLTILLRENQEKAAEKAGDMSTRSGAIASNDQDRKKSSFPWTDYLVARSLLRGGDASIAGLARRLTRALTERAQQVNDWAMLARLNCDLAEADAYQAGAPKALATSVPTDWHAADTRTSEDLLSTGSPTYWIAHQGYLAHPAGSATDLLLFDYPLAGSYEFSVECYAGAWAGSAVAHDGLSILPSPLGGNARVSQVGPSEILDIPWRLSRSDGFNRLTVHATPKSVRYLVNGHLLYEDDDPSPTSPWLAFATDRERHSVWRHATISGQPVIPREVRLSHDDRLEGWVSGFYGESQPAPD